jgi:hypothetical protein
VTVKALHLISGIAPYVAFVIWSALAIILLRYLFKHDYYKAKIVGLYAINTITFLLAAGICVKLAIIVQAPILETEQKSLETLKNYADNYFSDFILFSLIATCTLVIFNFLYLKYIAKTKGTKHILILLISDLTILVLASYISINNYFLGLSEEIYRNF